MTINQAAMLAHDTSVDLEAQLRKSLEAFNADLPLEQAIEGAVKSACRLGLQQGQGSKSVIAIKDKHIDIMAYILARAVHSPDAFTEFVESQQWGHELRMGDLKRLKVWADAENERCAR